MSAAKRGALCRIRLTNFMTYDDAVFAPGPGFNVVIGPNGSGKSSLVTAIAVGLGGDLAALRRQKKMADLVNKAAPADARAEVRISLYTGKRAASGEVLTHDISCAINRSGQVWHHIDGRRVDSAEVVRLAEQLQVQTANLCQFLPQEVVREFPEMSAEKIFRNTLRAVGNVEMLAMHDGLRGKQDEKRVQEELFSTKTSTYQDTEAKFKEAKGLREVVKQRKEVEDKLMRMKSQEKYLEVTDLRKKVKHYESKANEANEEKKKTDVEVKQLWAKVHEFEKRRSAVKDENRKLRKSLDEIELRMKRPRAQAIEDEIDELDKRIAAYEDEMVSSRASAEDLKAKIAEKRVELSALDEDKLEEEFRDKCRSVNKIEVDMSSAEREAADKEEKVRLAEKTLDLYRRKMAEKSSDDNKRLTILQSRNPDAFRGVEWLRRNKIRFASPDGVHEPIMMVLRLARPEFTVHVENVVGRMELEAFVCEDKDDANTLMDALRYEQKLKQINVVHCSAADRVVDRLPRDFRSLRPTVWLDQAIADDCPPAVVNHLRRKKKIHLVPVFKSEPASSQLPAFVRVYFVGRTRYDIFGSKYSSEKTKCVRSLDGLHAQYLSMSAADDSQVDQIRAEVGEREAGLADARQAVAEQKLAVAELAGMRRRALCDLDAIKGSRGQVGAVKRSLAGMEEQLRQLCCSSDIREVKQRAVEARESKAAELVPANRELADLLGRAAGWTVTVDLNTVRITQLEDMSLEDRNKYEDAMARNGSHKEDEKKFKKLRDDTKAEFTKKFAALPWVLDKSSSGLEMPRELRQAVDEHCPKFLPDVKAKIASLQTELANFRHISQRELNLVEELEVKKSRQQAELKTIRSTIEKLEKQLRDDEQTLIDGIQRIVESVNGRFSALMEEMGFAGQVALHKGSGELDFKNYGLKILVKFRNKDSLQPLSSCTQSGGEKSVTTALYIMALQEMTCVPFRCVDEINQGMDERNEKLVWELLVETANKHSAQFFYLAPKFPRQLVFDDHMTVYVCMNGPIKFKSKKSKSQSTADIINEMARRRKPKHQKSSHEREEKKKREMKN